jgi:hypothetical protein
VTILDPVLSEPDVDQPTARSKLVSQTYCRYVCLRENGTSAQLIRHHRPLVMPVHLFMQAPAEFFTDVKMYFGEYRRD